MEVMDEMELKGFIDILVGILMLEIIYQFLESRSKIYHVVSSSGIKESCLKGSSSLIKPH